MLLRIDDSNGRKFKRKNLDLQRSVKFPGDLRLLVFSPAGTGGCWKS
jgi:hypothetical protein